MFALAAAALMVMAVGLIVLGCGEFLYAVLNRESLAEPLLSAIGFIVIAIAVFDVAKFLIEEEVLTEAERGIASQARKSLTKFLSTILIALFLEGLVSVFRVSKDNVTQLIYPSLLLVAATFLVIGLGVYQRLSVTAEKADEHEDEKVDDGAQAQPAGVASRFGATQ